MFDPSEVGSEHKILFHKYLTPAESLQPHNLVTGGVTYLCQNKAYLKPTPERSYIINTRLTSKA